MYKWKTAAVDVHIIIFPVNLLCSRSLYSILEF